MLSSKYTTVIFTRNDYIPSALIFACMYIDKKCRIKFATILLNFTNAILYMHADNLTIIYAADNC